MPDCCYLCICYMKKASAVILFFIYLAATSGIVINSHYCMKKLVSVRIFEKKASVCGLCGMHMHANSGCCHDETKVLKMVQDQVKTPVTIYEISSLKSAVSYVSGFITAPVTSRDNQRHFCNHSPPLLSVRDIYLRNNVFRI